MKEDIGGTDSPSASSDSLSLGVVSDGSWVAWGPVSVEIERGGHTTSREGVMK